MSCSAAPGLDRYHHYLHSARRYRPHLLSESEEKILAEKSISSQAAWGRLFGELTSALRVDLDDEELTLDIALSRLQAPDRELRRATAEAVSAALEPGLRTRGFIYNTLVYDKSVEDRLRNYPHWLASRNLANEASDESVMALIEAVRNRFDIPQRWYRLKAKLLGVDRLADYDRSAPVLAEDVTFSYGEARDLVLDTYSVVRRRRPATITRRFFDERWIDAPTRPAQARRRLLRVHGSERASVRAAQLHRHPPRRADDGARARPRPARRARPAPGRVPPVDAADARRDRVGVRRGAGVRAAARRGDRRRAPARAARRAGRRRDRHRVPPDGDEPVRAPRAHAPADRGRAVGRPASTTRGSRRRPSCSAIRSRSPAATGCGGPTCRTSSTRPATCTRTPTACCWRCRSTAATCTRASRSCRATSSCCPPAARAAPSTWPRSSGSTSPIRGSGTPGSRSSRSSCAEAEQLAAKR